MRYVHAIDGIAVVLALLTLAVLVDWARNAPRARAMKERLMNAIFGPFKAVAGEPSLPFYVYVQLPEADYLATVTFRPFTVGRTRGRKGREVHAWVRMEEGEGIPIPDGRGGVWHLGSRILQHARNPEDAAAQIAARVLDMREKRSGRRDWTPARAD